MANPPLTVSEEWYEVLVLQRALLGAQEGGPTTGPPDLDVTRELINGFARLTVLLELQKARVPQMELGHHYTMVRKWVIGVEDQVHQLGQGSLGIMRVLKRCGY